MALYVHQLSHNPIPKGFWVHKEPIDACASCLILEMVSVKIQWSLIALRNTRFLNYKLLSHLSGVAFPHIRIDKEGIFGPPSAP